MATRIKLTEQLELGASFRRAFTASLFVGGIGLAAAMCIAYFADASFRRFYFAYLVSYLFFLSISLGAMFYVLIQHLTRAGWSVATRRVAETLACVLPMVAALSAPIVLSVILQKGELYRWAQPVHSQVAEHAVAVPHAEDAAHAGPKPLDELTLKKRAFLNPGFFLVRLFLYFAIWSIIGVQYWRLSVLQDETKDVALTHRMQTFSAPAMLIGFISVSFAAFDLVMSLDPTWFSTMMGIYFFGGCAVAIFATLILVLALLQKSGCLSQTITLEHYHDLGKFLFAFTFFWGYIAYSQYMLIWYASIPEEVGWYARRGASTVAEHISGWTTVSLALLFGHLLIPFAGLLSRHVKRNKPLLVFWSVWLLVFHWIDLYWLVMPELDGHVHFGILEVTCFIGIGGIFIAALLRIGLRHNLRPIADPRLEESLAFENV